MLLGQSFDRWAHGPRPAAAPTEPPVLRLADAGAFAPDRTGGKATALARALALGLPVLPGVVLTTGGVGRGADALAALREGWKEVSGGGHRPVIVRSSSPSEDGAGSSMAGVYTSVLDVRGWPAVVDAVEEVLESAGGAPMAVLLQPMLDAEVGGVLFGLDPVSGRRDRLLVEAVRGGPAPLVSGQRAGTRYLLTSRGRLLETDDHGTDLLGRRARRALAALAARVGEVFGSPQDVEWAFDRGGTMWMLQSRPITASATVRPLTGPVLGPGPVAETLPNPLSPLEADLWVEPLREGITTALAAVGATPSRALRRSPIVVSVGGRVAADLELFGMADHPHPLLHRLDPRPPAHRLAAAWRVGRLRRALPALVGDVVQRIDRELDGVPALSTLDDEELLDLVRGVRRPLVAAHGYEVLAGLLDAGTGRSAAALALDAVARGRAEGRSDADIVADEPVVLALTAPAVGGLPVLPPDAVALELPGDGALGHREALRLRARWLQELSALAAMELGRRLRRRGITRLDDDVRWLRADELATAVRRSILPGDVAARAAAEPPAPLPAAFRLDDQGVPVAVGRALGRNAAGRGAGGRRASGTVAVPGDEAPPMGSVLVVRTLEPGLAGVLPRLAGLVAETGSVLSHVAILARELAIPTVVGVDGAVERFPAGSTVVLDGTTGEVTLVDPEVAR